jgi:hypothetical protein
LVLPIRNRVHKYAKFGLADKTWAPSLADVEMTSAQNENFHMDVIFHVWVDVTLSTLSF